LRAMPAKKPAKRDNPAQPEHASKLIDARIKKLPDLARRDALPGSPPH
jgi:hypothetical protein